MLLWFSRPNLGGNRAVRIHGEFGRRNGIVTSEVYKIMWCGRGFLRAGSSGVRVTFGSDLRMG